MKRWIAALGTLLVLALAVPVPPACADRLAEAAKAVSGPVMNALTTYARHAIIAALAGQPAPAPPRLPAALSAAMPLCVTLTVQSRTVGCMGSFSPPAATLLEAVAQYAVAAATRDPRHTPIDPRQVSRVQVTIALLGPLRRAQSIRDLRPMSLGLLVRSGARSALLLPGEAKTADWQIAECRRKAGIPPGKAVDLFVFSTVTIGPGPREPSVAQAMHKEGLP